MEGWSVLQVLRDHCSDVTTCDISHNNLLATGSSDKTVRVWVWQVGLGFCPEKYSPLPRDRYAVTWVRFSPQGTMLASSSLDGITTLWNTRTGSRIYTLVQPTRSSVRRCEFAPDSLALVTASDDGALCFWDLLHGTLIKRYQLQDGDESCVLSLALSPDAELLATADTGGLLRVWALSRDLIETSEELECLSFLKNVNDGVACCAFSPKTELVVGDALVVRYTLATSGCDGIVLLWRVSAERGPKGDITVCDVVATQSLVGHESDVHDIRFNAGGSLVCSIGLDKMLRVWQVEDGQCLNVLSGHERYGNCCAFAKDASMLVSGSNDRLVLVWDLTGERTVHTELSTPCRIAEHFSTEISESNAEELVADHVEAEGNNLGLISSWDVGCTVNSCCFGSNNLLITAGGDKTLRLWNRNEDDTFSGGQVLRAHTYSVNHVDISSCGSRLISCSMDGVIVHYDIQTELSCELRSNLCCNSLRSCAFSPNVDFIAAAGDDEVVFLWDASSLEFLRIVQTHRDAVTDVAFSSDGQLLASTSSAGDVGVVTVFEENSWNFIHDNAHDLGAASCSFAAKYFLPNDGVDDMHILATCGNDSMVKVWRVALGFLELWTELAGHGGNVMSVEFCHKIPSLLVSAATDNTARIWNVRWQQCVYVIEHHTSMVTTCAFSADASLLCSGSLDKTVAVWRMPHQIADGSGKLPASERQKSLQNWSCVDLSQWLESMGYAKAAVKVTTCEISGRQILSQDSNSIIDECSIDDSDGRSEVAQLLWWLQQEALTPELSYDVEIPHQFLCPITHDMMMDPVICSDGFTYERAAITEWMLGGRFSSPMTNEPLKGAAFHLNAPLKKAIYLYLYGERPQE